MSHAQRLMEDRSAEKLSLPPNSLVLDAGSGEGNVAICLTQKYKYRIYGVDLLDFAIKKSVKKSVKTTDVARYNIVSAVKR